MIKARTIMNADPLRFDAKLSMREGARQMARRKAKMALVFDKDLFLGVVTEEEMLASVFIKKDAALATPISKIAQKGFLAVDASYSVDRIERTFKDEPISRFVVTQDDKPVGIISEIEHVAAMRDFTHYHYVMQEAILAVFGVTTAFFLFYFSPLGAVLRG